MKVLVVEDDLIALDIADTLLREHGFHSIDHYTNVEQAAKALRRNEYQLILLDIHLEDGKGTELVDLVPVNTRIIFTTVDPAYAVDAFEVNALDYLLKPITKERFAAAMEKMEGEKGEKTIFIKADLQYRKILVESILFIKSNKDYLTLHSDEGNYTFFGRIKNFKHKVPEADFMQCHRSYIINLRRVDAFSQNAVEIGEHSIPVSNRYKKEVASRVKEVNTL